MAKPSVFEFSSASSDSCNFDRLWKTHSCMFFSPNLHSKLILLLQELRIYYTNCACCCRRRRRRRCCYCCCCCCCCCYCWAHKNWEKYKALLCWWQHFTQYLSDGDKKRFFFVFIGCRSPSVHFSDCFCTNMASDIFLFWRMSEIISLKYRKYIKGGNKRIKKLKKNSKTRLIRIIHKYIPIYRIGKLWNVMEFNHLVKEEMIFVCRISKN
jgi:hypothetical protein